ncbi:hypothetical protein [Pedobacter cryotolerans]|uniref:Uracil-DNA glycosylase-like domain-containing protein n=1 Tax=Pedobacter cryotolerans TaxID=2571270 RepID=A0A4U1CAC7_9SPHI|nr:hypothetical protein [Pedobacter cryotolerans]TKC03423.1 hypothetical protein FA045_02300 [Pedobacter cryotolerans]
MAIQHKFYQTDFGNGFRTHNAILDTVPYEPEVMIIGTFNPGTENANFADFFYGRNYFWPALKNLINNNRILSKRRMPQRGIPPVLLNPSVSEILDICFKLKLTFSDIVLETMHTGNPQFQLQSNDNVIFNNEQFNLILDKREKGINGLCELNILRQVNWNTQNIIQYLKSNPQIKHVYLTRKPTEIWGNEWELIKNNSTISGRHFTNIFTPSGQGKPVWNSMERLLSHWVRNDNPNFGKLDNEWLLNNGIYPDNF